MSSAFSWSAGSLFSQFGAMQHISPQTEKSVGQACSSAVGTACTDAQHGTPVPEAPVPLPASPLLGCLGALGTCSMWGQAQNPASSPAGSLAGPQAAGEGL